MMLFAEQAYEILSVPGALQGKRPGEEPRCDEAVAKLLEEYRDRGTTPRLLPRTPARRACSVLLQYAHKYLSDAVFRNEPELLEEALLMMEVADAAALDEHEAGRILDRYILLRGSKNAATPLLSTAARLDVSRGLKQLIERRLEKMS